MIKLRQHVPNYVQVSADPKVWEAETIEELLEIEWVKSWSVNYNSLPFYRYSQGTYGNEYILMGEWKNDETHEWFVIGYLSCDAQLPEFKPTQL